MKKMKKINELKDKLKALETALLNGLISTNEYSSFYHATYQQIKANNKKIKK